MKKSTEIILKVILIYITLFASNSTLRKSPVIHPKQQFSKLLCEKIMGNDKTISALTYNVWGLPIWIPGHNQSKRFEKLPDSILTRDFAIICLQEVFHTKVRKKLMDKLSTHYFYASDYQCDKPILGNIIQKDCNGGLMTLSKYPIIDEQFYPFIPASNASLIEKIGNKGFLFTSILWNDQPINIINTHLYSGISVSAANHRMDQITQLHQKLQEIEAYHLYPTVLFGDLNITHPDLCHNENIFKSSHAYEYITEEMGFDDKARSMKEHMYTINPSLNTYCSNKESKQKLDYIMVHKTPDSVDKIWLTDQGTDFYGKSALSDHMGWKATINIANMD